MSMSRFSKRNQVPDAVIQQVALYRADAPVKRDRQRQDFLAGTIFPHGASLLATDRPADQNRS